MGSTGRASFLRLAVVLAVLLSLVLVACGGDDDDDGGGGNSDLPVISGAEELDSADASDEDMEELGAEVSDAKTAIYKTDKSFDDVSAFYADNAEMGADWTVDLHLPFDQTVTAVMHSGDTVALVLAMPGSDAKASPEIVEDESLDIDLDDIADDDMVILLAHFTCEEDDVATCVTALGQ